MKAKEYFEKFNNEDKDKEPLHRVVIIMSDMLNEVKDIQSMRRAKSNSSIISIFNEQNTKCNSFIRRVNKSEDLNIKRDSFKDFIKDQLPDLSVMIGWS